MTSPRNKRQKLFFRTVLISLVMSHCLPHQASAGSPWKKFVDQDTGQVIYIAKVYKSGSVRKGLYAIKPATDASEFEINCKDWTFRRKAPTVVDMGFSPWKLIMPYAKFNNLAKSLCKIN